MNQLTLEQQEKLEKLKIHLSALHSLLIAKEGIIPTVASLAAAILVVATFNPELLLIDVCFKIALTVLLILIPLSLFIFIMGMNRAIKESEKGIEKVVGIEFDKLVNSGDMDNRRAKLFDYIYDYFPLFGTLVLGAIILYIVISIW